MTELDRAQAETTAAGTSGDQGDPGTPGDPGASGTQQAEPGGGVPDDLLAPETAKPAPVQMPRLGAVGWARWAWRQLTSMRTALLLLMLLAVAAVPGSILPQNRVDPARVDEWVTSHAKLGPLLERLGMFDVYASPWFSAIYILLFVSLIGCVIPRTRQHGKAMRARPPRTPRRLERMPDHTVRVIAAAPADTVAAALTALRRRHYRVADDREPGADGAGQGAGQGADGGDVAAERGYLAETGNLVFHLGLLGLLISVATGSLFGYSGQATVVVGQQFADTLPRYDSFSAGSRVDTNDLPPFTFRLNSMDVSYETTVRSQMGAARGFGANITVRNSPDEPERSQTVQVNEPLDVNGARVFLSGNGYAPMITVRDGSGTVVKSGPVVFLPRDSNYTSLGVVKVPDAKPRQIALNGFFLPTAAVDAKTGLYSAFPGPQRPMLILAAYVSAPGEDGLGLNSGVPQSVFVLDTTKLTQLKDAQGEPLQIELGVGQSATLPGGSGTVTFEGYQRYGVFDIRYDPSKLPALLAALLALAGLTASLFVRRRRVWVRVTPGPDGGSRVEVAGLARGEDAGLGMELVSLLDALGPAREDSAESARAGTDPADPDPTCDPHDAETTSDDASKIKE